MIYKMPKPKEYCVGNNVSKDDLLNNGFVYDNGLYKLKKPLYILTLTKIAYIIATIIIRLNGDKSTIEISVDTFENKPYSPFYNEEERHSNLVYKTVVTNYNNYLDSLVKKKILKHKRVNNGKNKDKVYKR